MPCARNPKPSIWTPCHPKLYTVNPASYTLHSEDLAFTTFYGAANPPATYGYLGGTTAAAAKYSYDVPPGWKEEAPTKVIQPEHQTPKTFTLNPKQQCGRHWAVDPNLNSSTLKLVTLSLPP